MLNPDQFVYSLNRSCNLATTRLGARLVASFAAAILILVGMTCTASAQSETKTTSQQPTVMADKPTSNPALTVWYDKPAKIWMTEALPIGNGPMGAMLFGDTEIERVQFNEISLWNGDLVSKRLLGEDPQDEIDHLGAHQAFGDLFIHLGHESSKVTQYRRQLDIDRAVHSVEYVYEGTRFKQTAFASHPAGVIVLQLTADKPGLLTGQIQLTDMHNAEIVGSANRLQSTGKINNGMQYETQLLAKHVGGSVKTITREKGLSNPWEVKVPRTSLSFEKCDSLTLILSAGTSFLQDHTKGWLDPHPHDAVTKRVDQAANQSFDHLLAQHISDYQSLFRRFQLNVGSTAPDQLAKTTLVRLQDYATNKVPDPNLEALFCQFGRYLLISCSRPGSLPSNLQGV